MPSRLMMPLHESSLLDEAIDWRYPDLKAMRRSVSVSSKNPWQGTIYFYGETHTLTAVFEFTSSDRDGKPRFYVVHDWND